MMLIVGTLLPAVARAWNITDLFTVVIKGNIAEADTEPSTSNVQNMPLPKAALNMAAAQDSGGGDITIVDDSALVSDEGPSGTISRPKNSTISTYVVREGDTISAIAQMFDVTPSTILWANDIAKGTPLKVGQTLTILPVTGVKYTVRKGDTLATIAKKFDGDVDEIVSYNGIDNGALAVGTEVIIPNGEITAPAPTPVKKTASGVGKVVKTITSTVSAGYYSAPLASYVKTQGIHGYNGVDLAAPVGTPILAAAEGDVIVAKQGGYNGGYGSYVVIQHANGSQTLYAHQTTVYVGVGQHVAKGQTIGTVGNSGRVSGPTGYHLHFEIRNGVRNPF
jgi:murein DD-endopeptidase MepM/ murein hydrolase activator NlpD